MIACLDTLEGAYTKNEKCVQIGSHKLCVEMKSDMVCVIQASSAFVSMQLRPCLLDHLMAAASDTFFQSLTTKNCILARPVAPPVSECPPFPFGLCLQRLRW